MRQTITFPMETQSENAYRRGHPKAHARRTKEQRRQVGLYLTQLTRPPRQLHAAAFNVYKITLTRIGFRTLDDDNVYGALKAIRDEIALWLGLSDNSPLIRWEHPYQQELCGKGGQYVRVQIVDLVQGREDVDVHLGPPIPVRPSAGARPRMRQAALPFLRAWAALPWEQDGGEELVLTELPHLAGPAPPATITVAAPATAGHAVQITLRCRRVHEETLGGDLVIYEMEDDHDDEERIAVHADLGGAPRA